MMTVYTGDRGDNIFTGGSADDSAAGNAGDDRLSGGGGNDSLVGGEGGDTLDGGGGDDTLYSGAFANFTRYQISPKPVMDVGTEVDTLRGGAGDDLIFAGYGDNVDGGTENSSWGDTLIISFQGASSGVVADFRNATLSIGGGTITGIEGYYWVEGSEFDDDLTMNSHYDSEYLYGMGGNDRLVAGYYARHLYGGEGNDIVDGRGSQYLDRVDGGAGDDILYTNSNTFSAAYGGGGRDTMYVHGETWGGAGNDLIIMQPTYYRGGVYGEGGDDEIRASSLYGNLISGGGGADILTGDVASDTLVSGDFVKGSYFEPADDMGLQRDRLSGGGGDDFLAAGYGDNVDGGAGNDELRLSLGGATGGVTFNTAGIVSGQPASFGGGTIKNVENLTHLRGSEYGDTLTLATQATLLTVDAGAGNDLVSWGMSSVAVDGGRGNDRFIDNVAGDVIDGGAGIDTVDYVKAASGLSVTLAEAGATGTGAGGDQLLNIENVDGSGFGDTIRGNGDANVLRGRGGGDSLYGNGGSDVLVGGLGADRLDGGVGADLMKGGHGDDAYIVDNARDRAIENSADGGVDEVRSSASFALGDHVEHLTLTGAAAINATGNALANILTGNGAANVLDGKGGADEMIGGAGNDTYIVKQAGDVVTEQAGGGVDRVWSSIDYTLGDHLENLRLTGSAAIDGSGNGLANYLGGNNAANRLDGRGGADVMEGRDGDDLLDGGLGGDTLRGGAGADDFLFTTALGGGNVDTILDFTRGADRIVLENAIFKGLAAGALNAGALAIGAAAADAGDRIVYDPATGNLFYDADGSGAAAQILFATLGNAPATLAVSDFQVI